MTTLRCLLAILLLALGPSYAASDAASPGMAGANMVMAIAADHAALPDCCRDGTHQLPSCQAISALPLDEMPASAAAPPVAALRFAASAIRLRGENPELLLPPPRSA